MKVNQKYIQGKYYQNMIRSAIDVSVEIILNVFKYLIVSLSTQIFILAMA